MTVLTLAMVLASFAVMWFAPQRYLPVLPVLALYFGIVSGVQHWLVTGAMRRSPRTFVQVFLGSVVGVLFLHLIVLALYDFTHVEQAKLFTLAFGIGYAVCLVFETVALVRYVDRERKKNKQ